jgi:hypothetical protein
MTTYSLTLNFDTSVLTNIKRADQRVAIAKPVNSGGPSVIWLDIDPFPSTTIEWEENYWIYASNDEVANGATITKLTEVDPGPALDGGYYVLQDTSVFGGFTKSSGVLPVSPGTYAAINNVPYDDYNSLTFGLAQTALINKKPHERKPISAQSVLATQHIKMTPFVTLYIWLESEFKSQTIITEISGNSTPAVFGGGVTDVDLTYDPIHGKFLKID